MQKGSAGKSHGGGKASHGKSSTKAAGIAKGSKGKPGKEREEFAPPHHLEAAFFKHPDDKEEFELMRQGSRHIYVRRVNAHLFEACFDLGGDTALRTYDDICRYLRGELKEHMEFDPEAMGRAGI